ncbi:hypothetical protein J3454_04625 [Erythrobacter sp. NFXS35]|uniref:hypothetical protein n=1 Tax=Erythrobacter sp. NFXS35 TaxID=2818436 RepID=UPI0032DF7CE0
MMKLTRRQSLAAALVPLLPTVSCAVDEARPDGLVSPDLELALRPFDPAYWPGPILPSTQRELAPIMQQAAAAMRERDLALIERKVGIVINALGRYRGTPEVLPPYGRPIKFSAPDIRYVTNLVTKDYEAFAARGPWRDPKQRSTSPTTRLRITGRAAEAMIRLHLAGQGQDGLFLQEATKALDYAISVQAPNGVFGYPYIAEGGSGVAREAADLVRKQRASGNELTHKGWIIDDLNKGGLEFDNAIIGTTLLLANEVAPRQDYVEAALRAGEWALPRPFVININYNTLSAFLFARLFRVTGDQKWLEGAKDIFRYVVLPTQLNSGRWFDPHNARIEYHSIILRHGLELLQALAVANDPMRTVMEDSLRRGLDNLAAQIVLFGSSNTEELLASEALIIGEALLGENRLWKIATHIDINFLVDHLATALAARGLPISPPLALLVQQASALPATSSFELSLI